MPVTTRRFRPRAFFPALLVLAAESSFTRAADDSCLRASDLESAAEAGAWDEATGRDLRNFPPDRVVDLLHMKLEMRFENLNDQRFTAVETLRFTPIGSPAQSLTLDAVGLRFSRVTLDGKDVEHFIDDETITLRFDPPLEPETEHTAAFEYVCDHPIEGMIFTPSREEAPHYTAEMHTQGETNTNRSWFVCHDSPNERLATELIVDVPKHLVVCSNGRLVANFTNGDRAVWHWLQSKPHVAYLVSLVIGEFDRVELKHGRVPMAVWAPQGLGRQVQQTYGRTVEMLDVFERRFGVPYPWDRYDQIIVKSFRAGGMENTSVTTMYPTAILDERALLDEEPEGLIAHELAHQWAGDLITCKSWAHTWLNEGFATYGSALWFEARDGEDGYLDSMFRQHSVARRDRTSHPHAMVSNIYDRPFEVFHRPASAYSKGASILHMLRRMLGEDVFWRGMKLYFTRHSLGTAETSDFRYAMEEVSGLGLEWFFDQWCGRPGSPNLAVSIDYDGAARELFAKIVQTQQIDERTPAFRFTLPIVVRGDGGDRTFEVDVREKETNWRTTLDGAPRIVAVDPYGAVLADWTIEKPLALWHAQLADPPTIIALLRAIDALGKTNTAEHRRLLSGIVRDETKRHAVRSDAVRALRAYGSPESEEIIRSMLEEGMAEARVRETLVQALRDQPPDFVGGMLDRFAGEDESYSTRVAAIEGLAKLELKDRADLICELVHEPSQHDKVRNAALKALADLDDPRGLDLAIQYSAFGFMDRSRPVAIEVIGTLAKHDPDRALDVLLGCLHDPEWRSAEAAGAALAQTGDERAENPLQAIADTHPDPDRKKQAEGWLKTLREKMKERKQEPQEADKEG